MGYFVYNHAYQADMGDHIFPVEKYRLLYEKAIKEGILKKEDFLEPFEISEEDILRVHTPKYLMNLEDLARSPEDMFFFYTGENPVNRSILKAAKLACAGTYTASCIALERKIGMNLTGGFHHAFPDHAEGFCYLNDVAVAIRKLQQKAKIRRVMIIDCDVHQGNGTAYIFNKDKNVFTFSIHQEDNYPVKQKSDYDVGLYSGDLIDDKRYLEELLVLPSLIANFNPELIIYEAGADPYMQDKLGGFKLTKEGLRKRDYYIIRLAVERKIPIAIVLGGGYAYIIDDVVDIHLNTIKAVKNFISN